MNYINCLEITKIISNNNEEVISNFSNCINEPQKYFEKNKDEYCDRGITKYDVDETIWIGLVNNLLKYCYACELDWKVELETFEWSLRNIKNGNIINFQELDENDNIENWCAKINEKLMENNLGIGMIDINSDSYVLFMCELGNSEKLKLLAKNLDHKIDFFYKENKKIANYDDGPKKNNKSKNIYWYILPIISFICLVLYIISQKQINKPTKYINPPKVDLDITPAKSYEINNEVDENFTRDVFNLK